MRNTMLLQTLLAMTNQKPAGKETDSAKAPDVDLLPLPDPDEIDSLGEENKLLTRLSNAIQDPTKISDQEFLSIAADYQ